MSISLTSRSVAPAALCVLTLASGVGAQCIGFSDDVQFETAVNVGKVTAADFDGDGDIDLAAASDDAITVLLNDGTGNFVEPAVFNLDVESGGTINQLVSGDLDGDLDVDLAIVGLNVNVTILLNDGTGAFPTIVDTGHAGAGIAPFIAIGHLNNDDDLDLVLSVPSLVLLNDGNGGFKNTIPFPGSFDGSTIALGDLDRNGTTDIVTTNFSAGARIAYNSGDGTFVKGPLLPAGPAIVFGHIADVDSDGRNDILVANSVGRIGNPAGETGKITILFNEGSGVFSAPQAIEVGDNPRRVGTADIDDNGHLDLITANSEAGTVSVVSGQGERTFEPDVMFGNDPTDLAIADFDGDTRPDIAFAATGVSVLFNQTTRAGDANRDGTVDILDLLLLLQEWE